MKNAASNRIQEIKGTEVYYFQVRTVNSVWEISDGTVTFMENHPN